MQVGPRRAWVLALLLLVACGTPPHKEMDQAQGAIDAARAAGADRHATEAFSAAQRSLTLANEAVAQRDYRLALNRALESREQAQTAARLAAETQARLSGEYERSVTEIKLLFAQANGRLTTAERTRIPRRIVADARASLAMADSDLQKAGAAVQAQDFSAAQAALSGAKKRIEQVIARLDAALSGRRG